MCPIFKDQAVSNPFATSAREAVAGQRHASVAVPPVKTRGAPCMGGWVGLGACPDGHGKPRSHRHSVAGPSSP
jgi:hypothetical protein